VNLTEFVSALAEKVGKNSNEITNKKLRKTKKLDFLSAIVFPPQYLLESSVFYN
jgi:hypothetical protein